MVHRCQPPMNHSNAMTRMSWNVSIHFNVIDVEEFKCCYIGLSISMLSYSGDSQFCADVLDPWLINGSLGNDLDATRQDINQYWNNRSRVEINAAINRGEVAISVDEADTFDAGSMEYMFS
jgi:hypothetical protein